LLDACTEPMLGWLHIFLRGNVAALPSEWLVLCILATSSEFLTHAINHERLKTDVEFSFLARTLKGLVLHLDRSSWKCFSISYWFVSVREFDMLLWTWPDHKQD